MQNAQNAKMKCFVPGCKNNYKSNPELKFFKVPYSKERINWFAAVGKDSENVNMKSTYYCCGIHIEVSKFVNLILQNVSWLCFNVFKN